MPLARIDLVRGKTAAYCKTIGVYHFNPADVSLRLLRKNDLRGTLAQATAMEPAGSLAHDDRLHRHVLAERLEVPGPHLSAFWLG
jgi:hypothetical protein